MKMSKKLILILEVIALSPAPDPWWTFKFLHFFPSFGSM